MKKVSKQMQQMEASFSQPTFFPTNLFPNQPFSQPTMTVGIDLGDRFSHYCLLNSDGDVIEEGRMQSTEAALRRHFEGEPQLRIALECGTHSPWVSRLLKTLGHQPIIANTRKIRAITSSQSKNDKNDAELLARFAAHDPKLLSPIEHRSPERQADLNLIHVRATLRDWGLKLAASGGKRGKKRAIVAVARKLAVLLHSMWRNGQPFHAFPQAAKVAA
jgi:hypothetical protein